MARESETSRLKAMNTGGFGMQHADFDFVLTNKQYAHTARLETNRPKQRGYWSLPFPSMIHLVRPPCGCQPPEGTFWSGLPGH